MTFPGKLNRVQFGVLELIEWQQLFRGKINRVQFKIGADLYRTGNHMCSKSSGDSYSDSYADSYACRRTLKQLS
jgi:hypothetical protein